MLESESDVYFRSGGRTSYYVAVYGFCVSVKLKIQNSLCVGLIIIDTIHVFS